MVENKNGLSLELIIHPGETLKELIEDRGMSQKELAVRTGNSSKHISEVLNGAKGISVDFAKKLEYALSIDASFWINLQANYANEMVDFEEINHITDAEIRIRKKLKDIFNGLVNIGALEKGKNNSIDVLSLRKLLNISSLESIPDIVATGAYRVAAVDSADPYVMFAWLRMCELYTDKISEINPLNIELLIEKLPEIKKLMFIPVSKLISSLQDVFAECGIKFAIVPHFKGAPVQGVIKHDVDGSISLIMTIRQKFADIFWFTLMHEIGHIVNGDIKKRLIDYRNHTGPIEDKANEFARNALLDENMYNEFIQKEDFSLSSIKHLAKKNNVLHCIVIGRLQKEEEIEYTQYSAEKTRYKWE